MIRLMEEKEAGAVLALIRESFAYMDGRIDPPSSMHRLTKADLTGGDVWVEDAEGIRACMVLTPRANAVYLGKLSVDVRARGQGIARAMIAQAARRARELGLSAVELQTRVELVENQKAFSRMGFVLTGWTAHEGYDRATSLSYRLAVA